MSKVAIVYNSKYGSTERYSKWIAEETGAELLNGVKCKVDKLMGYDVIVFGGAIHAGKILGIDFVRKNIDKFSEKKVIVFAVGLNIDAATCQECRNINFTKRLSEIPCFFLKGAYNPKLVSGMDKVIIKVMMSMVKKMTSEKTDDEISNAENELISAIENGADFTDKTSIAPLVDAINGELK